MKASSICLRFSTSGRLLTTATMITPNVLCIRVCFSRVFTSARGAPPFFRSIWQPHAARFVDQLEEAGHDLAEVGGGDVRRVPDCDPAGAVDEEVRRLGRQDQRFHT